ncbi:hypothetical protein ABZ644_11610 [Nocardiopsis alba]|uniref:hypothetical protein n=1 Tax=Nocardiopsis alba TaxID=53437 RepID=UPI0033CFDC5D
MPNEPFRVLTPEDLAATEGSSADPIVSSAIDAGRRPSAARVEELAASGAPVLVRCDPAPETSAAPATPTTVPAPALAGTVPVEAAEEVALASVYAWAGARVFVTDHPERVRRALDMVASIRGERPPAAVRRGLV